MTGSTGNHRSLRLWLAAVLLLQSVAGFGAWHVEAPVGNAVPSGDCPVAVACERAGDEHHHTCHAGQAPAALVSRVHVAFPTGPSGDRIAWRPVRYTDPLAELPLRPPNA